MVSVSADIHRSKLSDFDFQLAEAVHEIGAHSLNVACDMNAHPAFVHFFQQNPQLQLCQPRADAAVNAMTKRDMAARILTLNVQLVRVVEYFFVAVGSQIP